MRAAHYWVRLLSSPAGENSDLPPSSLLHAQKSLYRALEFGTDGALAAQLLVALHRPMMFQGYWRVWEDTLRDFVRAAPVEKEGGYCFEARYFLAEICFRMGKLEESLALTQTNLAEAERRMDRAWVSALHDALAEIYVNQDRFDLAEEHARRAYAVAAEIGDPHRQADALINLGRAHLGAARTEQARSIFQQALAITQAAGDRIFAVKAYIFLGHSYGALNHWAEAFACFQAALDGVRSYGDRVGEGVVLNNLGRALLRLGRLEEAEEEIGAALAIHRAAENQLSISTALSLLEELACLRRSETGISDK